MLTSRERKKWRPTYKEVRDSFILWLEGLEDLETEINKINQRSKRCEQTLRPLIIVVGVDIKKISVFLVYYGGIYYSLPTFQKALDVCFKTFKIYDISFPHLSSGVWNLINHCIYGFEPESVCHAKVVSIANAISIRD